MSGVGARAFIGSHFAVILSAAKNPALVRLFKGPKRDSSLRSERHANWRLQTGNGWLGHPLPVIEPLGRRVMYTDRVAACKIRDRTVVGQFDVEAALCRHMAR